MRVAELAGIEVDDALRACLASLDPEAPSDYRELAALLACSWGSAPPRLVGLAGGQGAGKSTLGRLIESACAQVGLRACVLALDDFYRTRAERRALAESIHPLLETRGPPGTHDMRRCAEAMEALQRGVEVELPVFDKGLDDRVGTRQETGPFDLIVLEGWCVGARAASVEALEMASNPLEARADAEGIWRRFVNRALVEQYEPVWGRLDRLVYLRVPTLDAVKRWRLEQERMRPLPLRMSSAQVDRFVQHYERITRAMFDSLPGFADWVIVLDESHDIAEVSISRA
jgi:D-glycerate 3-kinase